MKHTNKLMYFHKKIRADHAYDELRNVRIADKIDPEYKYHIGNPVLTDKDHQLVQKQIETNITITYPYGGTSLDKIRMGQLPKDGIINIITGLKNLFLGVQHFHHNGLYHLDIKTSNLVLDKNGVIRLIDFGISRHWSTKGYNMIFDNTYAVWPFETHLISGEDQSILFTDDIYGDYIKDPYFKRLSSFLKQDLSDIKYNIVKLRSSIPRDQLEDTIYRRIDVYSLGMLLANILVSSGVSRILDKDLYLALYQLAVKLAEVDIFRRLSIDQAVDEYLRIIN